MQNASPEQVSWLEAAVMSATGPSISFLLGLIGVILGALYNARLARKRDDRMREQEAKAVGAALYGEILLLRLNIADVANVIGATFIAEGTEPHPSMKFDNNFLERAVLDQPIIYPAIASKLGLLAPDLVLAITSFHAKLQMMRTWIPRMVDSDSRGFNYSVLSVLRPAQSAVEDIKPALSKIEWWLDIATPAVTPKMSQALDAIDIEESFEEAVIEQRP